MSAPEDPTGPEPDVGAAEFALGLLEGEERAVALRRVLSDPAFAAQVEVWRGRFGELFETWPEVAAPAQAEARLEQALRAGEGGPAPARPPRFWIGLAGTASLVAAALLLVVITHAPRTQPAERALVAAIEPLSGATPLAALYDPGSGHLTLAANRLGQPGHSAQLWVIGKSGPPRSLGLMAATARTDLALPPGTRAQMAQGVTIAVSIEPLGGSPTGQPTGPVVAKGILLSA